ncbi:hypothetical protein FV139_16535 [Parahaliea maris]|uniref:Uncharacterized protein n=1 Tax=Parahaliea maris TaxID=2716870 RepID=A0A5C8ZV38_9GAMM|nr:hypothetical protein [Parahaliea maris]TXS91337.1 hypothetical protein FV139_16535 [Parahaliea maris]
MTPSPASISKNIGLCIFLFVVIGWISVVILDLQQTAHAYPDYKDLFRWTFQFVEPLAATDKPKILASLFSEFEFPGHGHVLTKSVILYVSQYANYNLHVLRLIGAASYFLLLALLVYGAAYDMKRTSGRINWWIITFLIMLFTHPEERNSLGNNLLIFEYTFILLAWVFVFLTYRYLKNDCGLIPVLVSIIAATLFSDIAFTLAFASAATLVVLALTSRQRKVYELRFIAILFISLPVIIVLAGAQENSSAQTQSLDIVRFLQWVCAGLGSGLISGTSLVRLGLTQPEAYSTLTFLGALLFFGIVVTAIDQLAYRHPANLGSAMIVFGTLSLVGSFLTRNYLGDEYVMAPRYVRYTSFAVCGLAWYWLIAIPERTKFAPTRTPAKILTVAGWSLVLAIYFYQVNAFRLSTPFFASYHHQQEAALQAFANGEDNDTGKINRIMPKELRESPELARNAVKFYLECRKGSDICKVK